MDRSDVVGLSGWERTAVAVAAAVYVVAWIVGLGISFSYPSADASAKDWANYLNSNQGLVVFQEYLIHGLAAIALIVFAAGVRTFLRGTGTRFLSDVAFAGAIAAASVSLVQATVGQIFATKAGPTGDSALVSTIMGLDNQADTYKLLGLILFVVAASLAFLATGRTPSWVAWGGVVVGILLLLGSWSFPINFAPLGLALDLSLLGLLAWVAVSAVFVYRRSSNPGITAGLSKK
jgi:hypothetical protein